MVDVFISCARVNEARVETLATALEEAGLTIWWDCELGAGDTFSSSIETALNAARAVIVVWSKDSVSFDWVRDEASKAKSAGKLIPIRIDEAAPPLGFQQLHTVDLAHWRGDARDPAFTDLVASVGRLAGVQQSPPRSGRRRRRKSAIAEQKTAPPLPMRPLAPGRLW